jgi:hypothetical protein
LIFKSVITMKKSLLLFLFIVCILTALKAQEVPAPSPADSVKAQDVPAPSPVDSVKVQDVPAAVSADTLKAKDAGLSASPDASEIRKNLIKFNITAALIKNYSLQYERILTRTVSAALSIRIMPETGIPYTDNIIRWFDINDPEAQTVIENTLIGNYAITPEIRFYTGKKRYGNGFYFSLFYRYGHYTFNNALIPYDTDLGDQVTLNSSGNVSSHTGGFMIGAQWTLGKSICLDWWILGPHFGVSSGDFNSLSSAPLSETDQQNIEDDLNDIDIPMFEQTVNVTADKVSMIFNGPWGGIRAGLSLGFKF